MSNYNSNYVEDLQPLILNGIYQALSNTHTNLLAKITKVNATTINAQPVVNRVVDGKSIPLPPFEEIPVINFIGGTSYIQMPLAIGDYCILFVNERSIDNWYYGKDFTSPIIPRMHDYSDCVALVGLHNKNGELTIPDTIKINGDTKTIGNWNMIGNVDILGDLTIIGDIKVTGNIEITSGDLTVDGVSFKNHIHGGVTTGSDSTGIAQ